QRVEALLEAGWHRVKLVTDHGWVLVPTGLPSVPLPKYLASTRWSRCAVLETTAKVDYPIVDWHWASTVRVAAPRGIGCFKANKQYVHGGLTLQECLTPVLSVSSSGTKTGGVVIEAATWRGLRCRVRASGALFDNHQVDLR